MLCKEYQELSHFEKIKYIGELVHACQTNNTLFETGLSIIEKAKSEGIFDKATILPPKTDNDERIT